VKGKSVTVGTLLAHGGTATDLAAREWPTGVQSCHSARAEREKGRAVRGRGRLARRLCHWCGRGLSPGRGCMHAHVLQRYDDAGLEIELGWEKEERERMTRGVHRS
jgi:hypothetical protein